MCGIGGMVGPGADAAVVARMMVAQRHRGPDGDGLWSGAGVLLPFRTDNLHYPTMDTAFPGSLFLEDTCMGEETGFF